LGIGPEGDEALSSHHIWMCIPEAYGDFPYWSVQQNISTEMTEFSTLHNSNGDVWKEFEKMKKMSPISAS
jgi:hypothetical protein